jgi:hypothetical protein
MHPKGKGMLAWCHCDSAWVCRPAFLAAFVILEGEARLRSIPAHPAIAAGQILRSADVEGDRMSQLIPVETLEDGAASWSPWSSANAGRSIVEQHGVGLTPSTCGRRSASWCGGTRSAPPGGAIGDRACRKKKMLDPGAAYNQVTDVLFPSPNLDS